MANNSLLLQYVISPALGTGYMRNGEDRYRKQHKRDDSVGTRT